MFSTAIPADRRNKAATVANPQGSNKYVKQSCLKSRGTIPCPFTRSQRIASNGLEILSDAHAREQLRIIHPAGSYAMCAALTRQFADENILKTAGVPDFVVATDHWHEPGAVNSVEHALSRHFEAADYDNIIKIRYYLTEDRGYCMVTMQEFARMCNRIAMRNEPLIKNKKNEPLLNRLVEIQIKARRVI